MLNSGRYDVIALVPKLSISADQGQVVGFGRAAGKDYFKRLGKWYQNTMNNMLRNYLEAHQF